MSAVVRSALRRVTKTWLHHRLKGKTCIMWKYSYGYIVSNWLFSWSRNCIQQKGHMAHIEKVFLIDKNQGAGNLVTRLYFAHFAQIRFRAPQEPIHLWSARVLSDFLSDWWNHHGSSAYPGLALEILRSQLIEELKRNIFALFKQSAGRIPRARRRPFEACTHAIFPRGNITAVISSKLDFIILSLLIYSIVIIKCYQSSPS